MTAYLAAGDRGDWEAVRQCLADDVVTHAAGGAVTVGAQPLLESWRAARRGLDDLTHEVGQLLGSDDTVAARVVVTGVHVGPFLGVAPTGARLRVDQALFARVEGGRIAELWEVVDTGAGLQQLGVLGGQALSP